METKTITQEEGVTSVDNTAQLTRGGGGGGRGKEEEEQECHWCDIRRRQEC